MFLENLTEALPRNDIRKKRFFSLELWLALGMLSLSLSIVIERNIAPSPMANFIQGLCVGVTLADNIVAIVLLASRRIST